MRKAAISTGLMLTIGASLIGAVATSIIWAENLVSTAVAPVQAETNQNTAAIVGIQTDLSWIKAALNDSNIRPHSQFSSSSRQ